MTIQVTLGNPALNRAISNFANASGSSVAAANTLAALLNSNPFVVNQLNTAFNNGTLKTFLVNTQLDPTILASYTTSNTAINFTPGLISSLSAGLASNDPALLNFAFVLSHETWHAYQAIVVNGQVMEPEQAAYNQALDGSGPIDITAPLGQWLIGTATDENGANINGWNGYADYVSHITAGPLTLANYINPNLVDFMPDFIQGGSFISGFVLGGQIGSTPAGIMLSQIGSGLTTNIKTESPLFFFNGNSLSLGSWYPLRDLDSELAFTLESLPANRIVDLSLASLSALLNSNGSDPTGGNPINLTPDSLVQATIGAFAGSKSFIDPSTGFTYNLSAGASIRTLVGTAPDGSVSAWVDGVGANLNLSNAVIQIDPNSSATITGLIAVGAAHKLADLPGRGANATKCRAIIPWRPICTPISTAAPCAAIPRGRCFGRSSGGGERSPPRRSRKLTLMR